MVTPKKIGVTFFMREFQLIEKFFKPLTNKNKASLGLADDVAQIDNLVISKDMMVEDVHFLKSDGGHKIAAKLLRSNISDIAAAGATPLFYMLGFSKNSSTDQKFYREFSNGLKETQEKFGISLIGGDTVNSEKLVFSVTIFGKKTENKILDRSQAKNGDLIYVSGTIGDAFIGRTEKTSKYFIDRHFFPTPRIELGKKLIEKKLSKCAADVSDGLIADIGQICKSSQLSAEIILEKIPFSAEAKNPLDLVTAGDDYELVFSANPKNVKKIEQLSKELELDLTCIGSFKSAKNSEVSLISKGKKIKLTKHGYEH